jgi:hypothetical protein
MIFGQAQEAIWHRRRLQPDVREVFDHVSQAVPPIESIFEFGQISWYMCEIESLGVEHNNNCYSRYLSLIPRHSVLRRQKAPSKS